MHVDPPQTSAGKSSFGDEGQDLLMFSNRYLRQSLQQTQHLVTIAKRAAGQFADYEPMAPDTAFIQ